MKSTLLTAAAAAVAVATFFVSQPVSAGKYGMAGCGVGSLVFQPGQSQLLASSTNQTFYQVFSITTGTSNCTPDDMKAAQRMEQEVFVHVNMVSLEHEMAAGQGEKVAAFARLMGCPTNAFGAYTRSNYKALQPQMADPGQFVDFVRKQMTSDKNLAKACSI